MRRAGMKPDERMELKKLYRLLFRSGKSLRAAAAQAQQEFSSAPAKTMLEFVAASRRGLCADTGKLVGSED
jgi:UDP-N-acetylglucosamine acyltransferase